MAALDTQRRAARGSNLRGPTRGSAKGEASGPPPGRGDPARSTQECQPDQMPRLFLFILFKTKSHSATFLNSECWKPVTAKNCSFDDLFEECDISL